MYKIALFFVFISIPFTNILSQDNYSEWLSIGVYMPQEQYEGVLTKEQVQKLETKIISIIANNGIAAKISAFRIQFSSDQEGEANNSTLMKMMAKGVVCIPKFEIYNDQIVDTGMKKIRVVDVSLTLRVQYIYEDIIYSNLTVQLQGTGGSTEQAINSAIRNIRSKGSKWTKFLEDTHNEIVRYYDTMCEKLMEQARQLNKLNLTSDALAILWPIPKEVTCHETVKELTIEIFHNHVNRECRKQIQLAKSLLAGNRYDEGLSILGTIDPSSICAEEATQLMESMQIEFDENEERNRNTDLLLLREERKLAEAQEKNISDVVARHREPIFRERILEVN